MHPPGSDEFLLLEETFKKVEENKGPISSANMRHGLCGFLLSARTFLFAAAFLLGSVSFAVLSRGHKTLPPESTLHL